MSRVYISFLGTSDYTECLYYRTGFEMDRPVRFVQEATVLDNCKAWGKSDRIVIFTTRDAEKKNWRDDGHLNLKTGEKLIRKGLESCLTALDLSVPILKEPIPDGHTEAEVWEIFESVSGCLEEGDEVVFDITHAFRSIPLLAVIVLNYAKVLKKVSLQGIFYGAFEALGAPPRVKEMPMENRRVRILDFTSLDQLMDWTVATDRFLATGDATMAGTLARKGVKGILRERGRADTAAQAINHLGLAMENFSTMISTCRGPEIVSTASRLCECLGQTQGLDLPHPFRPLFDLLQQRMTAFMGNPMLDGLAAARWCLDHNLIQQGYTILEEIIFSHVIEAVGGDQRRLKDREMASRAFSILSRKRTGDKDRMEAAEDLTEKMVGFIENHDGLKSFCGRLELLRGRRNDLNHAGFKGEDLSVKRASKFREDLEGLIEKLQNAFIPEADSKERTLPTGSEQGDCPNERATLNRR